MRTRTLLLAAATISLAFAPAPRPKPRKQSEDVKLIQGTWEIVSRTRAGNPVSHIVSTAEITATTLTLVNASGDWRSPFTLTLDPTKKPPWFEKRSVKGTTTSLGIYELQGDSLKLAYTSRGGGVRPTDFDATRPGVTVDVYRRRKP